MWRKRDKDKAWGKRERPRTRGWNPEESWLEQADGGGVGEWGSQGTGQSSGREQSAGKAAVLSWEVGLWLPGPSPLSFSLSYTFPTSPPR